MKINKKKREELAKEFMKIIIAKQPLVITENDDVFHEVARGAVLYADALVKALK